MSTQSGSKDRSLEGLLSCTDKTSPQRARKCLFLSWTQAFGSPFFRSSKGTRPWPMSFVSRVAESQGHSDPQSG